MVVRPDDEDGADGKEVCEESAEKAKKKCGAENFLLLVREPDKVPNNNRLQAENSNGGKNPHHGGGITQHPVLCRPQVAGDADADDEPDAHAEEPVREQPAAVLNR